VTTQLQQERAAYLIRTGAWVLAAPGIWSTPALSTIRQQPPVQTEPALVTVSADEPPGFHVALAFHVDEPYRLSDEVVAQELPGRTRDLDLV